MQPVLRVAGLTKSFVVHAHGDLALPVLRDVALAVSPGECLALVGPLILARSGKSSGSLGELVWMTGGLLIWIFDVVGMASGTVKWADWATPLGERTMGLIILAVLLAGKAGAFITGQTLIADGGVTIGG